MKNKTDKHPVELYCARGAFAQRALSIFNLFLPFDVEGFDIRAGASYRTMIASIWGEAQANESKEVLDANHVRHVVLVATSTLKICLRQLPKISVQKRKPLGYAFTQGGFLPLSRVPYVGVRNCRSLPRGHLRISKRVAIEPKHLPQIAIDSKNKIELR